MCRADSIIGFFYNINRNAEVVGWILERKEEGGRWWKDKFFDSRQKIFEQIYEKLWLIFSFLNENNYILWTFMISLDFSLFLYGVISFSNWWWWNLLTLKNIDITWMIWFNTSTYSQFIKYWIVFSSVD